MKHFISGMAIALALALVLVIGVVALAESAGNEADALPAVEDVQPAPEAQPTETETTDDQAALQDAFKALDDARQNSRQESLEAELNGYVDAGKLTREQADLILNYYKDQQSLRNGTCPGCGYQFGNGQRGGMKGSGFGRGGKGGQRGGMMGNGFGRGSMQGFAGSAQAMPEMNEGA